MGSEMCIRDRNQDVVKIDSGQTTIALRFDGAFEGRIDRMADGGWSITPDDYNAVTPKLLTFEVSHGGHAHSYEPTSAQPLEPNATTPLQLVR